MLDLYKNSLASEDSIRGSINNKANLIVVVIISFLGFSKLDVLQTFQLNYIIIKATRIVIL
ncbi:hypothetical protein Q3304_09050 [Clostridioides sp. GD02377]|uniref:hypothetical protein n=1 Tax=unclassified Clostridioides TaxID=2635829 RepID=UPI0038A00BA7